MRSLLYILVLFAITLGCNKDKLETTPSLKLRSISASTIPVGGILTVQLDYTDKEGDVSDSIFVKKIRTNRVVVSTVRDSFAFAIPKFPDKSKGIIELNLRYDFHLVSAANPPSRGNPPNPEDDTLILKFALQDKAKHISDTVTTGPVFVIR